MADPFTEVQSEVQHSLQTTLSLLDTYRRIKSTASTDSEELNWARNELHANITTLESDIQDLDDSVRVVEESGPQTFGLAKDEVLRRRKYVGQVRSEINRIKIELFPKGKQRESQAMNYPPSSGERPVDDQAEWSKQEQQMLIQRQDQTLDSIQGTLYTLAEQAGLMGREIGEHNEMLEDLESGVDRSQSKLSASMKKLQKFIRDTEETRSGWCIGILILILCILLLVVILI